MASSLLRESSFTDTDQNNTIIGALYRQKQSETFCDVIMKVCGREIHAHSNVLAAASPYFSAFLSQDLPRQFSQRSPQVIEIQIDGSEPNMQYEEAVASVIDFIYTGKMKVNPANVSQISEIARIMQIESVVRFCEAFQANKVGAGGMVEAPSMRLFIDRSVNTEHVFPPFMDVLTKLKAGRLVSVSTQVTPLLLGVNPQPKEYREGKTQTSERDFQDKSTSKETKPRGRKPKNKPAPEPVKETEQKETTDGKVADDIAEVVEPPVQKEKEGEQPTDGGDHVDEEGDHDSDVEDNDDIQDDEGYDVEYLQFQVERDNTVTLRRSSRRPKPTPKAQSRGKRKIVSGTGAPRGRPKKLKLDTQEKELAEEKPNSSETEDNTEPPEAIEEENIDVEEEKAITRRGRKRGLNKRGRPVKSKFPTRYSCDVCDYMTNKVRDMTNHKKLHKIEQNICYYCEQKFEKRELLNDHLEKHKGPTPFFCPICDFRFKSRTQLNLHLPKHSDEKPYICEICSMGFKWKHALKNHMIVHSNKKDHLCDVCGYATAHKSQLKAHRLIHTGQTYRCDYPFCTFQATKRQNLKYHMFTHSREKPHQCEICGQSFSLVKNMRRHMLLHSTAKPHGCEQCEFATTRFDKLKEHMLKQHGFGTPPEKRVRISDLVSRNKNEPQIEPSMVYEPAPEEASGSTEQVQVTPQADGDDKSVVQTTMPMEDKPVEIIPGQTIIITQQAVEDGEVQPAGIAVPVATPNVVGQDGQGTEQFEAVGYTEVMIPVSQVAEYVQHVAFVTQ